MTIYRNSAICLKCDDHLVSRHRHDFKTCKCGATFVDGGLDYQRGGSEFAIDTSITDKNSFQQIRHSFAWGSYGKDGKGKLEYLKLYAIGDDHIEAILKTLPDGQGFIKKLFMDEQVFRLNEKIKELKDKHANNS